jgi:hypothetical protein
MTTTTGKKKLTRRSVLGGIAIAIAAIPVLVLWRRRRTDTSLEDRPEPVKPPRSAADSVRVLFTSLGPFPPEQVEPWVRRLLHQRRQCAPCTGNDADLDALATRYASPQPLTEIDIAGLPPRQLDLLKALLVEIYDAGVSQTMLGEPPLGIFMGTESYTQPPRVARGFIKAGVWSR